MTQTVRTDDAAPLADALRPPRLPRLSPDASAPAPVVAGLTPGAEADARALGVRVAVIADGVFFAALLSAYVTLRQARPEVFAHGRFFLDAQIGALQSCILFASACAGVLATRAAAAGRMGAAIVCMTSVGLTAGLFLIAQGEEYASLAHRGLLPGRHFVPVETVWETPSFRREHPEAARYAARFVADRPGPAEHGLPSALVAVGAVGDHAVYPEVPYQPRNAHLFFGVFLLLRGALGAHVAAGALLWLWALHRSSQLRPARLSVEWLGPLPFAWSALAAFQAVIFPLLYLVR